jgi:hypothetical protein
MTNDLDLRKIRLFGMLLLLAMATGCYSGGWHHDHPYRDNSIREDSRGNVESSESYRTTERDHTNGWTAEGASDQTFQGYSTNSH